MIVVLGEISIFAVTLEKSKCLRSYGNPWMLNPWMFPTNGGFSISLS
jgi:hypothetical protein